jgi:ribose transport system permease protein
MTHTHPGREGGLPTWPPGDDSATRDQAVVRKRSRLIAGAPVRKLRLFEVAFLPLSIVIAVVIFSTLNGTFFTTANLLNIGTSSAILGIVAVGETLVIVAGGFDLSVGAQVAVVGTVSALAMRGTGSIAVGVVIGLVAALVYGAINGVLISRISINPFIATLGTLVIGEGVALAISNAEPVGGLPPSIINFALGTPLGWSWPAWILVACLAVGIFLLHFSPLGVRLLAVGGNFEAARSTGLPVRRLVFASFVLCALFSGIAGIVQTGQLGAGQPTADSLLSLYAIAAAVLGGNSIAGGRGSMWGTLFGVILIGVIEDGLTILGVAAAYQDLAVGIVFLLAASGDFIRDRLLQS